MALNKKDREVIKALLSDYDDGLLQFHQYALDSQMNRVLEHIEAVRRLVDPTQ